LWRTPGATAAAVLTLAVGIGLNAAIFSMINLLLLRPLPYRDAERLVQVWTRDAQAGAENFVVSPADVVDWGKQARSFSSLTAYNVDMPDLQLADGAVRVPGAVVTSNFFETLGVTPLLGRTFAPDEGTPEKRLLLVVSHGFWQTRLGGRPDVIGQTLTLSGKPFTVIGVLRPDYRHPEPTWDQTAQLWRPMALTEGRGRGSRYLRAIARLKPGVSLDQAQTELTAIAQRLAAAYPESNAKRGVSLVSLRAQFTGDLGRLLALLQGAVVCVLLIACANVANLLLARVAVRTPEFAVRGALGAGRGRLLRMGLTESLVLAALGGALSLLFAYGGIAFLSAFAPADFAHYGDAQVMRELRLDVGVLGFALLAALATVFCFGLAPAWQAARTNLNAALKSSRQSARGGRLRSALVIAEIALALVLLAGAGLLLRGLASLQRTDLGFRAENLLTIVMSVPRGVEEARMAAFHEQVLAGIQTLPGVESAALTSTLPLTGLNDQSTGITMVGQPAPTGDSPPMAEYRTISSDYLRTMGMRLVRGRPLDGRDQPTTPRVLLVNEAFARAFFPDADPIGRQIIPGLNSAEEPDTPHEIVGVIADFKHGGLQSPVAPAIFAALAQDSLDMGVLTVRTSGPPEALSAAVQGAVWAVDKNTPLSNLVTMERIVDNLTARPRFNLLLLGAFALTALALAAGGVYGVMSYAVAQQTREIGIRMALGAQRGAVLRRVLWQGARLIAAGVMLGLLAAFGLTRLLTGLPTELPADVRATDPLTFAGVAVLLAVVALFACYLPARRATRVDPMIALRTE
jgi:putative ABC transport system permease protein